MSEHQTGALDSCGRPRTHGVVPVGRASAPSRIISSDEPEPRLEHVLGGSSTVPSAIDANAIAIGADRSETREMATSQRWRPSALVLGHPETAVGLGVTVGPRRATCARHHLKVCRIDTRHRFHRGSLRRRCPTWRRRWRSRSRGVRSDAAAGTPVIVIVGNPRLSTCAPIWFQHRAQVDHVGSRAACESW